MNNFDQFRTPEEVAQDEMRELHINDECPGAPECWICKEEVDAATKRVMGAFDKVMNWIHLERYKERGHCSKNCSTCNWFAELERRDLESVD